METKNNGMMSSLMESFNRASEFYQEDMDSVMSSVAIEILVMKDNTSMRSMTFLDKGMLLLCDQNSKVSETVSENIKACMFWWVFNEEIIDNEVKYLVEKALRIRKR